MFNPSELTVKAARSRLSELDLSGLEAVLKAEIDGKHRSSLISAIGSAIDELKTNAEDQVLEDLKEEAPATPEPGVTQGQWYRLTRHQKSLLRVCPDGLYRKK
tara:strand:+ start:7417 stop:7725 length:309 start_codon:yes stop_codon:yes gene_type:complete